MNSKELMEKAVKCMDSKKAIDIKVLDISKVTTMADYFVICQGGSSTQMKAIADEIDEKFSESGIKPFGREGMNTAYWILMDYSDVIIHIFNSESRSFYSIENLWSDAEIVDISEIIKD
ncbi:MAG: ribosome silencing factor [Clostridia bacterium]|nr:ribosome silencing factor [Clostridia bacterium]